MNPAEFVDTFEEIDINREKHFISIRLTDGRKFVKRIDCDMPIEGCSDEERRIFKNYIDTICDLFLFIKSNNRNPGEIKVKMAVRCPSEARLYNTLKYLNYNITAQ